MPSSLRFEIRAGVIAVWRAHLVVVEQRVGVDQAAVRGLATDPRSTAPIRKLRSRPLLSAQELTRREEVLRPSDQPPWNAATARDGVRMASRLRLSRVAITVRTDNPR
jgi:hypothetical protein